MPLYNINSGPRGFLQPDETFVGSPAIITTQSFNATTSEVAFGDVASQDLLAQTVLSLFCALGAGENFAGYIICKTPDNASENFRVYVGHIAPHSFWAGFGSTTANFPVRGSDIHISDGVWSHGAATWDGGLNGSGIFLYTAQAGHRLAEVSSYAATFDGTGSPSTSTGNKLAIGNRPVDQARTFNGNIAYVARWNRVLSLTELLLAQAWGPQAVPFGLVFYWINGRDEGPYHLQPTSQTAVGVGPTVPTSLSCFGMPSP